MKKVSSLSPHQHWCLFRFDGIGPGRPSGVPGVSSRPSRDRVAFIIRCGLLYRRGQRYLESEASGADKGEEVSAYDGQVWGS